MGILSRNPYGASPAAKQPSSPRFAALASATGSEASGNANVPNARVNHRTGSMIEGAEALIGANGELNASSKKEVMAAMTVLQHHLQSGKIKREAKMTCITSSAERARMHDRLKQANAAYKAGDSRPMQVLGEVMADEIWQTLGREGFARKILALKQLNGDETGRLKVRRKDVVAYVATSATNVQPTTVRQFYVYPNEFSITAQVLMDDVDIAQSGGDLMEEKYQDGLEAVMVQEDRLLRQLMVGSATGANDTFLFATLTPAVLSEMQNQVWSWGIPPTTAIIAFDLWNDIRTDSEFASYFDPVTKHELIMEGTLGSFYGMQIVTDAYKHDTLRVLQNGEIFVLGAPQSIGGITIRQELQTKAIDQYANGKMQRGWFYGMIEGMAVVSPRGIVLGQKAA